MLILDDKTHFLIGVNFAWTKGGEPRKSRFFYKGYTKEREKVRPDKTLRIAPDSLSTWKK